MLVRSRMTPDVLTVTPSTSLGEALRITREENIRHLPVVENGELIGVISIGDLVKEVIAEQEQTIKQLESYIHS